MDDPPPPPPAKPPAEPAGGSQALQLTVRVGERPIGTRVAAKQGELVPETPLDLRVRRSATGWELTAPDGTSRHIGARETVSLRHGDVEVQVAPVRQSRFARFNWEQGDVVLPVIMLSMTVLLLQIALLLRLFASPAPHGSPEPTPEYIARLLDEQFDGKDQGVIAKSTPRPGGGEAIESYYLQPGHDGPREVVGGGKNVGDKVRDGEKDGAETQARPTVTTEAGDTEDEDRPIDEVVVEEEEKAEEDELEDKPIAVHVDEGWGLTDWYDTEDARKDARQIQQQLEVAHQLLRLNPDDPAGLTIRAYYEYLALDLAAAKKTYDKFTRLYPDDPAGWNNLALVYKREGAYEKEEELYRIALGLSPDDDHALNNLAVCLAHQGRFDEALAIMEKLEVLTPDDPYADLHRAKIYAAMGKEERSYRFLQKSLAGMRKLDTLHNIEFRQDIRVDPAFTEMREQERFGKMLTRYYGEKSEGWWNKIKGR